MSGPGGRQSARSFSGESGEQMMKPHISVSIPVYQGASTLVATLRSVLASARADFEVVIRDNGSTDGTSDVIAGFDDPRIRLI